MSDTNHSFLTFQHAERTESSNRRSLALDNAFALIENQFDSMRSLCMRYKLYKADHPMKPTLRQLAESWEPIGQMYVDLLSMFDMIGSSGLVPSRHDMGGAGDAVLIGRPGHAPVLIDSRGHTPQSESHANMIGLNIFSEHRISHPHLDTLNQLLWADFKMKYSIFNTDFSLPNTFLSMWQRLAHTDGLVWKPVPEIKTFRLWWDITYQKDVVIGSYKSWMDSWFANLILDGAIILYQHSETRNSLF